MATQQGYVTMKKGSIITHAQLTATGVTDVIKLIGCSTLCYQYTIASIATNVVVRAEGSNDNSSWFNLDVDDGDVTQTADGTYAFYFEGEVSFTRFRFVSESGTSTATIDVVAYLGAPSK